MGFTLTDVLLFGGAKENDADNAAFVIMRRNILRWGAIGGYVSIVVHGVPPLVLPDAIDGDIVSLKAFGGTYQGLPAGYDPVNFIYFLDGAYLLTNLVPTYDCKIEMDFATTSVQSSAVTYLGARDTSSGNDGIRFSHVSSAAFRVYGFGSTSDSTSTAQNNTRYKFVWNNQNAIISSGGVEIFNKTYTTTGTNTTAVAINGWNSGGTISGNTEGIYLYSFKMWNSQGQLIANYVPCAQTNPLTVGLYDLVSKTFISAPTSGTWAAGPAAGAEVTPTPDAPIDIICNNGVIGADSNGDPIVTGTVETINVHGKNLIDSSLLQQGGLGDSNGAQSSGNARIRTPFFRVQGNTRYSFSTNTSSVVLRSNKVHYYDKNQQWISFTAITSNSPSNAVYARLVLQHDVSTVDITPEEGAAAKPQFEQGSTATEYQPYFNGGTATCENLFAIGDYADQQDVISGEVTRQIGIKVFDGTESFSFSNTFNYTVIDRNSVKEEFICTHFPYSSASSSNAPDLSCIAYSSRNIGFKMASMNGNTTNFKAWVKAQYDAGTPVIVVYRLATSTTESVAGQPMATTQGDNIAEITQASLTGLELEAQYSAAVSLTIEEVEDAQLSPDVEVTIQ